MTQKCASCQEENKLLIRVKVYLGRDEDYGYQYTVEWWCLKCVSK